MNLSTDTTHSGRKSFCNSTETIAGDTELRQSQYLNNIIEQGQRAIKRIVKPMMGFKMFNSARRTLRGDRSDEYD
jgi:transposase-like protein